MSEAKDVVCNACFRKTQQVTQLDEPVRRLAERCQHEQYTRYPGFTIA